MSKRRMTATFLVLGLLGLCSTKFHKEEPKTDPRFSQVMEEQLKQRIDFIFAPSDFFKEQPELVKNIVLPAFGLASYDNDNTSSN